MALFLLLSKNISMGHIAAMFFHYHEYSHSFIHCPAALTKALNVYSSAAENSRLQKNHSVWQKLRCPRKLLGPLFDIKKNIEYRSFC